MSLLRFRASLNAVEAEAIGSTMHADARRAMLFSRLLQRAELPDREARTLAFARLGHIWKHSNDRGDAGSYVNWLTRRAFDDYLERQAIPEASELLRFLVEGGPLRAYEQLVARTLPPARLVLAASARADAQVRHRPHHDRIRSLQLPEGAKRILSAWIDHQTDAERRETHFVPVDPFLDRIAEGLFFPGHGELIGRVLATAVDSPLTFYRLQRLYGLLSHGDHLTIYKLRELADERLHLLGRRVPRPPAPPWRDDRPSQLNGYVGEDAPIELLEELHWHQEELLDPVRCEGRTAARARALADLERLRAPPYAQDTSLWARAFARLGDAYARRIAADLTSKKLGLELFDTEPAWAERCHALGLGDDSFSDNALYLHPGVTGGVPLMLVKTFAAGHGASTAHRDPFYVMTKIAHEYQHFLDIDPAERRTQEVVYLQEMRAHLREAWWSAQYGHVSKLASFHRDGTTGLALHWRDKFESLYGHWFKASSDGGQ